MVSSNGEGDPSDFPIRLQKGLYDQFRVGGFPTLYPADQTPVTADILEGGWIYATVILAFSFLILLPGLRIVSGVSSFIRIVVGVGVLGMIMICNFGQDWESASLAKTTTAYRAGIPYEVNASIGVHIGLRSVNITLKGIPRIQTFDNGRVNETIDYNERLGWDNNGWVQGAAGFGPRAGKFNREFRDHQRRGTPYPILWVAEYFTPDGEGLRWGRFYRNAGYFAHIMVWTALPLWLLTLVLSKMVIRYAAYCSLMTGASLLIANIIYASLRNANQLEIPFPDGNLVFHWGWSFWMCMAMGLIACVIGIVVFVLNFFIPEAIDDFFGIDVNQEFEEFYISPNEEETGRRKSQIFGKSFRKRTVILTQSKSGGGGGVELRKAGNGGGGGGGYKNGTHLTLNTNTDPNDIEIGMQGSASPEPVIQRGYRKRTILGPMHKSRKSQPRPSTPGAVPPATYENQAMSSEATEGTSHEQDEYVNSYEQSM